MISSPEAFPVPDSIVQILATFRSFQTCAIMIGAFPLFTSYVVTREAVARNWQLSGSDTKVSCGLWVREVSGGRQQHLPYVWKCLQNEISFRFTSDIIFMGIYFMNISCPHLIVHNI